MCHYLRKKCLNATRFYINQNRLEEYSCCKTVLLKDNIILYIICVYRSPNSTIDNNNLNKTIDDVSKLKGELLLLGGFDYPNINW